jgi:hypothetical protein
MRTSMKKVAASVIVGALAAGGLLVATPSLAHAGNYSGQTTCNTTAKMYGNGRKGNSGSITVVAGYYQYTDGSSATGRVISVSSRTYAGSWEAKGAGATSGWGSCGS